MVVHNKIFLFHMLKSWSVFLACFDIDNCNFWHKHKTINYKSYVDFWHNWLLTTNQNIFGVRNLIFFALFRSCLTVLAVAGTQLSKIVIKLMISDYKLYRSNKNQLLIFFLFKLLKLSLVFHEKNWKKSRTICQNSFEFLR